MKKKISYLLRTLVLLLSGFGEMHAQMPGTPVLPIREKKNIYGGSGIDPAQCISNTSDGGYIVAGSTTSNNGIISGNHGGTDLWLMKFGSSGNMEWQKVMGGTGTEFANSVKQTADGGYIIAGESTSADGDVTTGNQGSADFWVIKLSALGILEWQKTFGGPGDDKPFSVLQSADGGYVLAGYTEADGGDVTGYHGGNSDAWIIKLNSSGQNIQWQKTFGGTDGEAALSIVEVNPNEYAVAGSSASSNGDLPLNNGLSDFWIFKFSYDTAANTVNLDWSNLYGGTDHDHARSIIRTADGGYAVAGDAASADGLVTGNHGAQDFWVLKLNAAGNLLWQKALGGSYMEWTQSIIQTADGGYALAGVTLSNNGDVSGNHGAGDFWMVKLNNLGALQWQKTYGGTNFEWANSLIRTTDNGYVLAGSSDSGNGDISGPKYGSTDTFILKVDAAGNIMRQWEDTAP
ncbi:T9SS C-terminal target domain-containing protein [uncultured Chryseobacterium sp.]|uniref:T9SS C-terminal target domain-containing protein n=1 Tax=uncultured Chryseobacterium sp. TaxID=259322 RepID=UPI0025EED88F|nr:T9SS C-terminal target domain-containing protein [uncultured Chryseobacterium sp.]